MKKNPAAVALGKLGGKIGGKWKGRKGLAAMSPEKRAAVRAAALETRRRKQS